MPKPLTQTTGRHVELRADRRAVPLEVDGVGVPPAALVTVDVVPGAFLLVV